MKLLPTTQSLHIEFLAESYRGNPEWVTTDVEHLLLKQQNTALSPVYLNFEQTLIEGGFTTKYIRAVLLRFVSLSLAVHGITETLPAPPQPQRCWFENDQKELCEIAGSVTMPSGSAKIDNDLRMVAVMEKIFQQFGERFAKAA